MCKKIAFASLVAATGLFVLGQTRLSSYGCALWKQARTSVKQQVPIEFEIERVRNEVAQLLPDMQKNLSVIAGEMVAVQNLKEDIDAVRANLDRQRENLRTMKDDLKAGTARIVYDGRSYSAGRIRDKLALDLASCQRLEREIESKQQLLEAKERSLDAAREQLASMRSQKDELEIQIAQLEADMKTVRLAQTRSKFQLDDSRLAHIKSSLAELRTRLKIEKTTAELQGEFSNDPIPVERKTKSNEQVIQEAEAYLGDSPRHDSKVALESQQ